MAAGLGSGASSWTPPSAAGGLCVTHRSPCEVALILGSLKPNLQSGQEASTLK